MNNVVTTLVIDDDSNVCRCVGAILNAEGSRVLLASDAEEGLEHVRNEPVDVLFTDLRLPGEDGISVIRKSLQIRPELATVVFTGAATLESSVEALRLGACDYVTKPIDRRKTVSAFRRALRLKDLTKAATQQTAIRPTNGKPPQVSFVVACTSMREVVSLASKIACLDFPVLIQGEIGVGKKLLARWIHSQSSRANGPFSHVSCATLRDSEPSLGLELLRRQRAGIRDGQPWNELVGHSERGTLFLEDIDELPLWAQVQLLDVVEGSWLPTPWTSTSSLRAVRVIASTTANLEAAVSAGRFHRGLYDHLNLKPIEIPPLRKRRDDITPLGIHILEQFSRSQNRDRSPCCRQVSEEVWELLRRYNWPGNVRELASMLARVVLLGDGNGINKTLQEQLRSLQQPTNGDSISVPLTGDLKLMERHMVREVVKRYGGNKAAAARALGMHRRTLYRVLDNGKPSPNERASFGQHVGPHS